MSDIDPDIGKKHDLRTTEGKKAAEKEQAERDVYKKWAKKNNYDPDATPTEDVLKEFEKNRNWLGRYVVLFLVLSSFFGLLNESGLRPEVIDEDLLLIGIIILSAVLTPIIYRTFAMWSWFKLKVLIILMLIAAPFSALEENKKDVTEQTPSADITSSDLTENNGTSVKSED